MTCLDFKKANVCVMTWWFLSSLAVSRVLAQTLLRMELDFRLRVESRALSKFVISYPIQRLYE